MSITTDKQYRTKDGRPVWLYHVHGEQCLPVHGATYDGPQWGWTVRQWDRNGRRAQPWEADTEIVEVTFADTFVEQIPWDALCADIRWVAMQPNGQWCGFNSEPARHGWLELWDATCKGAYKLSAVAMPRVDLKRWEETRCKRPEAT